MEEDLAKAKFFMNLALKKAWKYQLLTYPNPAVGCVITNEFDEILSVAAHKKAGHAHAELRAVKKALQKLNPKLKFPKNPNDLYEFILNNHENLLQNAKAYVTLEPCSHFGKTPPCASLLANLNFKKVFIGSKDVNLKKSGIDILKKSGVKVKTGICQKKCDELLEPFLAWQKGNFSFFKLAMSLNGVITGGIISNKLSRTHSHKLRSLVDLLVIGGNTVRIDRPILDTRLIKNAKNPDILIYSHSKNFDEKIPLFSVRDRKVFIENSLESIKEKKFVIIEGGENFLKNLPKNIEWILIYQSNRFLEKENIKLNLNLKILHKTKLGEDTLIWAKILK